MSFSAQPCEADPLTDDAVAGHFRLWQRKRGHRYSLDDVVTAWEAARAAPHAKTYLDLGCGIGSVLHMVAWKLEEAQVVGIEAQRISFELATRNVERNGLGHRVRLIHGDLRDEALRSSLKGPFDLITGTPPYMPRGTATPSTDPQRAHARIEMRGGVEDYLAAGAAWMAEGGRLLVCADARTPERALWAAAEVGLKPLRRRDVIPRAARKGPLFTVWTFGLPTGKVVPMHHEPSFVARDSGGARTEQALEVRRFFDLPVNEMEAPSP
jgi:tRNA1(Val) A37 N6-methylase TrmN6